MVKELRVEEPKKAPFTWEQQQELLFDFTTSEIPLPDEYVAYMKEQLNYYPGERDAAMVKAEKEWDAYHMWSHFDDVTPRERLNSYFNERCACKGEFNCEAHRA
jgi:hypothetical protein